MAQLEWKNGVGYIPAVGDEYGNAAKLIQQSLSGIGSAIGELGDRNSLEQLKMYSNPDDYNTALQNGNVRTNNASTKALSDMLGYTDKLQTRRASDTTNASELIKQIGLRFDNTSKDLHNQSTVESIQNTKRNNAREQSNADITNPSMLDKTLSVNEASTFAQQQQLANAKADKTVANLRFQTSAEWKNYFDSLAGDPDRGAIINSAIKAFPSLAPLTTVAMVDSVGNPNTTGQQQQQQQGQRENQQSPNTAPSGAAIQGLLKGKLPAPAKVYVTPTDARVATPPPGSAFALRNAAYANEYSEPKKIATPEQMAYAIYGNESNYGKADTSKVNDQGVTGAMQVQKGTFDNLKKRGDIPDYYNFNTPEHTKAAGEKLVSILWKKYKGDPAKVAAAYYSGEKAVNADGTINIHWGNNKHPSHHTVGEYILKATGINLMYAGDPAQQLATNQQQQQGNTAPNGASAVIAQATQQNMPTPAATPPAAASASAGTNFTNTIDSKQPFDAERFAARASDLVVDSNKALQQVSGVPGEYFDYSKLGLEAALAKAKALNWEGDNLNRLYNEAKKVPELSNLNNAQLAVIAASAGVTPSDDKIGFGYFDTEAMTKIVRQAKAASGSDYTVNKEILTGLESQRSSVVKQITEADTVLKQLSQNYKLTGNPGLLQNMASVQAQKDDLVRKLEGNMNQTSAINGRILKNAPTDKSGEEESKGGRVPTSAEDLAIQGGISEYKENTWIPSMFLSSDAVEPNAKKIAEMRKVINNVGNELAWSGDWKARTEHINKHSGLLNEYLDGVAKTNKEGRLFEKTLTKEINDMKTAALFGKTYKNPLIPPGKAMSPAATRKYVEYRKLYNNVTK